MDRKSIRILLLILTALLCGIPGIVGFCFGSLAIFGSMVPETDLARSDAKVAFYTGIAVLCISLFLVAIPIVVGIFTLGKKSKS